MNEVIIKQSIQLTTEPLNEIFKKGESIDFRLDQATWQELRAGDYVEFWEDFTGWQQQPAANSRKAIVKIVNIYRAPSFRELFEIIEKDLQKLGDKEGLLSSLRDWWSEDKETKEGVLAFHVKLVG